MAITSGLNMLQLAINVSDDLTISRTGDSGKFIIKGSMPVKWKTDENGLYVRDKDGKLIPGDGSCLTVTGGSAMVVGTVSGVLDLAAGTAVSVNGDTIVKPYNFMICFVA